MKIIVIGDIHGRDIIPKLKNIKADLFIFLGDYVDSFTKTNEEIIEVLHSILNFKKSNPNKVILLWGNHDLEYYLNPPWIALKSMITGFRGETHNDLYHIFYDNKDLFQFSYQIKNHIWTHAGIESNWYDQFKYNIKDWGIDDYTVSEQLNEAFKDKLPCLFDCDVKRGGSNKYGGPMWVSMMRVANNPLPNYHQYVGHTHTNDVYTYNHDNKTSIMFCDILTEENNLRTITLEI